MKLSSRLILTVAVPVSVWLVSTPLAAPQAAGQRSQMSDVVFKNVQALKGISVDDFLGTMGIMSASVGYDCSECHIGAGTDKVNWAADDNPKKLIARQMVIMVANINKQNFGGSLNVTCWTCHHGRDRPSTTPAMEAVYGPGSMETDDVITSAPGTQPPDKILDRYLNVLGGADELAKIKSYVATGSSVGFGGFGGGGHVEIDAKFPDERATFIKFDASTGRTDSDRTYNGKLGWIKTPLAVLTDYQLTGAELDGARLDAELSFPAQIKQVLTNLRTGLDVTISDLPGPSSQTDNQKPGADQPMVDRLVNVVQGTGPRGMLATMYFDQKSGLLLRVIRYGKTPIGRVPTQVDYSDYREVNGIKMPFRMTFAWLDGRDAIQLSDVKANVAIDEAKFGHPK
jgi:photosynthetic reaction center cytochrome c subunit